MLERGPGGPSSLPSLVEWVPEDRIPQQRRREAPKQDSPTATMRSTRYLMAPRPNVTGFDPKKMAEASRSAKGDPWARYEAWRYTGPFTRWNRFKGSFPGLGIATVAFGVYLVAEQLFFKDKHHDDVQGGHAMTT